MARDRRHLAAALVLLLVLSCLLLSSHLNAPFDKNHIGFTAAWYSLSARNFLVYGPGKLWGCLSIESGPPAAHPRLYLDHPPMVSLVLAGVFRVFGEGELQARTTALILSLLAVFFFFLFARMVFEGAVWLAFFGTLLAASTPVWAFYGTLVDPHGPGLLLAMSGALWAGASRLGKRKMPYLAAACGFVALGCLYDWAAVLIAGPLGLWFLLQKGGKGGRGAMAVWGTWAVLFALLLLQVFLAAGAAGLEGGLLAPLVKRSSLSAGTHAFHGKALSAWEVLLQVAKWNWKGIPFPLSLMGWAGAILAFRDARRGRAPWEAALLWVPLIMGACISLVFLEASFEHDYLQIYFAPGLGLGAAYLLYRILKSHPSRARLVRRTALAYLAISIAWGAYRSRNRWALQEEGLRLYKEAGRSVAESVEPSGYLLSGTGFLPPLAFYSRRRIYWDVRSPSDLPGGRETGPMKMKGVLLEGGRRSGFLLDLARRKGMKGPFSLAGGDLDLYLWTGGGPARKGRRKR